MGISSRPIVAEQAAPRAEHATTAQAFVMASALAGVATTIVALAVCFYHLGTYGLWEPDEARYAEIAREMLVLHDFVTPHLNYVPYVEKPPLLYWVTALSMRLFGVNEFAARLPNALAALTGIAAAWWFARRVLSPRQALLTALILSTSALYALMAQVLTTDMLLTATVTIALCAFYLQWAEGGGWWWLMYVAIALGVLTKGPVAIAVPLLVGTVFLTTERAWRDALRRFHVAAGLGLIILIAAPWFIAIAVRQPDFLAFYFVGEHLRRFFEASYSHGEPIYYYLPVLAGGVLPWSLIAPFLPWRSTISTPAKRFCLIAASTIFVLFSLASAKLIPYILPALPFIAILLASGIDEFFEGRDCRSLAVIGPVLGLAGVGVLAVSQYADRFVSRNPALVQPVLPVAAIILLVAGILCFWTFWQRRAIAGLSVLGGAAFALLIVASSGRLLAQPARSYAQLARAIAQLAPHARLVCFPRYIQSLPFYTHRRVVLVGPPTELAYGAAHASDGREYFFTRRADLMRLWSDPTPTVLIVDQSAMPALAPALGEFTVIAEDSKKVAIERGSAMRDQITNE
jgi:4-amino-4-deoxy-L-arabinose transferase-like glycosyltransferase